MTKRKFQYNNIDDDYLRFDNIDDDYLSEHSASSSSESAMDVCPLCNQEKDWQSQVCGTCVRNGNMLENYVDTVIS